MVSRTISGFLLAIFVKKKTELIFSIFQNSCFVIKWHKYFHPFKPALQFKLVFKKTLIYLLMIEGI